MIGGGPAATTTMEQDRATKTIHLVRVVLRHTATTCRDPMTATGVCLLILRRSPLSLMSVSTATMIDTKIEEGIIVEETVGALIEVGGGGMRTKKLTTTTTMSANVIRTIEDVKADRRHHLDDEALQLMMLIADEIGIVDPVEGHGHHPEVVVPAAEVTVCRDGHREGGGVRANRDDDGPVLALEVFLLEGDDRPVMRETVEDGAAPRGRGPRNEAVVHGPRRAVDEKAAEVVVFVTTITTAWATTTTEAVVAIVDITTTTRTTARTTKRAKGRQMSPRRFIKLLTTSTAQTAPHRQQLLAPLKEAAGENRIVATTRRNIDSITTMVGLEVEAAKEAAGEGMAVRSTMTTTTIAKTMTSNLPQADGIKAGTTRAIGPADVVRNGNAIRPLGRRNETTAMIANHMKRRNAGVLRKRRSAGVDLPSITSRNDMKMVNIKLAISRKHTCSKLLKVLHPQWICHH